ncbi:MAG: ABC transporter ATP-binding protein [Candidatus Caldarchaeum sp.]|nr:ABC transporter ATP-binding protein [Candidatus Caldarchaeum sp.]MDW8063737.1 ABC transporter ATP-binding protein [Candidatus Caldarchaeum sp.]
MAADILRLENVSAGYDPELPIIKDINMRIGEGQFVALVGSNGAGKSTLLKTIFGFLKPISGKIFYKSFDITGKGSHQVKRMGIAYIPQDLTPFGNMTVEENLKMGSWTRRNDKNLKQRLESVYQTFPNLGQKRRMKASSLSGGEAKMLDIARGMMVKPDLILVDEPSVGLSPIMAEQIYATLKKINNQEQIAILLVDQNVKRAIEISEYTYYMENGEIKYHGPSDKIINVVDKIIEATLMGDLVRF